jgi:hypothetical protein
VSLQKRELSAVDTQSSSSVSASTVHAVHTSETQSWVPEQWSGSFDWARQQLRSLVSEEFVDAPQVMVSHFISVVQISVMRQSVSAEHSKVVQMPSSSA